MMIYLFRLRAMQLLDKFVFVNKIQVDSKCSSSMFISLKSDSRGRRIVRIVAVWNMTVDVTREAVELSNISG